MQQRKLPPLTTWMLEHLTPGERDEALAGDLIEQFRAGRSAGWFRCQAVAAIALEWGRSLWRRLGAIFFAAIWSLLSPAWELEYLRHFRNGRLDDVMWRFPFPLSTICAVALGVARDMIFIWLGVLVYVMLCRISLGKLHLRRFGRAFLWSFLAYAVAGTLLIAIALVSGPYSYGRGVDWRTLTMIGVLKNITLGTATGYIPFFFGTAGALWVLSSITRRSAKVAA